MTTKFDDYTSLFKIALSDSLSAINATDNDHAEYDQHIRQISSNIASDSVLSVMYDMFSDLSTLSDCIQSFYDQLDKSENLISVRSNSIFEAPAGFLVHQCPIKATDSFSRSGSAPDNVQMTMISSMLVESLQGNELQQTTLLELGNEIPDTSKTAANLNLFEVQPKKSSLLMSNNIKVLFLQLMTILEKLKIFVYTCSFKQTYFNGQMSIHNCVNVYPELPVDVENNKTTHYAAVLTSPFAKHYDSRITKSQSLKRIFQTGSETSINAVTFDTLIYTDQAESDYPTFDITSSEGSNGKLMYFKKITTETYDLKSQLTDIIQMFGLVSGNLISKKKVLQAIAYIFELWQQNLKVFQCDFYVCHYNCHTNGLTKSDAADPAIRDYYYTITHELNASSFPSELLDNIEFASLQTSYRFISSRTSESASDESKYNPVTDRVPIVMTYPMYTGLTPSLRIPVRVEARITKLYPSDDMANHKTVYYNTPYFLNSTVNNIQLSVQDQGLNTNGELVPGYSAHHPVTVDDIYSNNILSCPGNITFEFFYDTSSEHKIYTLTDDKLRCKASDIPVKGIYETFEDTGTDKPEFINMDYRGSQQFRTQQCPVLSDFDIYYHYDSNPSNTADPNYWTKLEPYLSVYTYNIANPEYNPDLPESEESNPKYITLTARTLITSDDAQGHSWNTSTGLGVKPAWTFSYENSTVVRNSEDDKNAVVTIIPVYESMFGGVLTASYGISQLQLLDLNSTNMDIDFTALAKSEMDSYQEGNGPFTPEVYVKEGDVEVPINDYWEVEYLNNEMAGTATVIVKPTKRNEGKFGECYYSNVKTLMFTIKPRPSADDPRVIGNYQYTAGDNIKLKNEFTGGFILDGDAGEAETAHKSSLAWNDNGFWYVPDDDRVRERKNRNRSIDFYTPALPIDITTVTIRYYICYAWGDGDWVTGVIAAAINDATVWTDVYCGKITKSVATGPIMSGFTTIQMSSNVDDRRIRLKATAFSPNGGIPRFVSFAIYYDSKSQSATDERDAVLTSKTAIYINCKTSDTAPSPYNTWAKIGKGNNDKKMVAISQCLATSTKFKEYFKKINPPTYYINSSKVEVQCSTWNIEIKSLNLTYHNIYTVKYNSSNELDWENCSPTFVEWTAPTETGDVETDTEKIIEYTQILKNFQEINLTPLDDRTDDERQLQEALAEKMTITQPNVNLIDTSKPTPEDKWYSIPTFSTTKSCVKSNTLAKSGLSQIIASVGRSKYYVEGDTRSKTNTAVTIFFLDADDNPINQCVVPYETPDNTTTNATLDWNSCTDFPDIDLTSGTSDNIKAIRSYKSIHIEPKR